MRNRIQLEKFLKLNCFWGPYICFTSLCDGMNGIANGEHLELNAQRVLSEILRADTTLTSLEKRKGKKWQLTKDEVREKQANFTNEMLQVDTTSISLNINGSRGKKIGPREEMKWLLTFSKTGDFRAKKDMVVSLDPSPKKHTWLKHTNIFVCSLSL